MTQENHSNRREKIASDKRILALVFIIGGSFSCGFAQSLPIAPEPEGSGARALGQSAFIAVADDDANVSGKAAHDGIHIAVPDVTEIGLFDKRNAGFTVHDRASVLFVPMVYISRLWMTSFRIN